MFRTFPLSIIRSLSLYTQQWHYVMQVCWQLASSQAVSKPVRHIPLLCVFWKTPDDGQRNCPKHTGFYSKNKFEKLVRLVGFIIWMQYVCLQKLDAFLFPVPLFNILSRSVRWCEAIMRGRLGRGLSNRRQTNGVLNLAVNQDPPFEFQPPPAMKWNLGPLPEFIFRSPPKLKGCSAPGLKAIDYILSQGPSWRHPVLSRDAVLWQPAICDFEKDLACKSWWCLCGAVQGIEPGWGL